MTTRRIKDLPEGDYKEILQQAEKFGVDLETGLSDGNSIIILGLADMIYKMQGQIDHLEKLAYSDK